MQTMPNTNCSQRYAGAGTLPERATSLIFFPSYFAWRRCVGWLVRVELDGNPDVKLISLLASSDVNVIFIFRGRTLLDNSGQTIDRFVLPAGEKRRVPAQGYDPAVMGKFIGRDRT